jgi:hypothetical protein
MRAVVKTGHVRHDHAITREESDSTHLRTRELEKRVSESQLPKEWQVRRRQKLAADLPARE